MRKLKSLGVVVAAIALLAGVSACDTASEPDANHQEQDARDNSYTKLVAAEPAHTMDYSSSRATINFWIDKWGQPNKLAYVYLVNSEGKPLGYYITKGLPVSYCAALTPPYQMADGGGDGENLKVPVPAPGVDGVYYSGDQCDTYYAQDATTDAYIEYTAGLGINVLLYDQPLPAFNGATALGPTSVDDVK